MRVKKFKAYTFKEQRTSFLKSEKVRYLIATAYFLQLI